MGKSSKKISKKLKKPKIVKKPKVVKKLVSQETRRDKYDDIKEQSAARRHNLSLLGRDIFPRPRVVSGTRKKKALRSFKFFCEAYFPGTFKLAWSPDHLTIIRKVELAVDGRGLFAIAAPRGEGKSVIAEAAAMWATLSGRHNFVVLIGPSLKHASDMLDSIKTEFETNDLLFADFPEVCYPVQRLGGIYQRAKGQLYEGKPTYIQWTADTLVLPTIPGSLASGAKLRVASIDSGVRGMKYKRVDGETVRPSLVILDDPQTDESAKSPMQVETRLGILNGAILNLAGPGKKISGIMPCTVIQPDDMADQILDRSKNPLWQGERLKMVLSFPTNTGLWDKYAEIYTESLNAEGDITEATAFYKKNRTAMDEGAAVSWKERYADGELSAIQHAMNLLFRNRRAFFAEYQNDPLPPEDEKDASITVELVMSRMNGYRRRTVPIGADVLTMFTDVQKGLLYWVVVAFEGNFTSYVVDYGTYPDQKIARFSNETAKKTLQLEFSQVQWEGSIYAGLGRLMDQTLGREWIRDDGMVMHIDKCVIDANWGKSTDIVYKFCRESRYSSIITPSHGRGITAAMAPMVEYKKRVGDKVGLNWRIPGKRNTGRAVRHLIYDTNFWKTFVATRLISEIGDLGSLSIFGRSTEDRRLLAEHLASEYSVPTEGRERRVDQWAPKVGTRDNHWFDCLVGCFVAASIHGRKLLAPVHIGPKKKRIKLSDIQKRNKGKRG